MFGIWGSGIHISKHRLTLLNQCLNNNLFVRVSGKVQAKLTNG